MRQLTNIFLLFAVMMFCVLGARAQLVVIVSPPKVVGQKVVVQLKMKNNLADTVESARAACFLSDNQSKTIGESTKWVIGKNGLEPKGEVTFNFVVSSHQPFTMTNLTAKITFNNLTLGSGKVADVRQSVQVIPVNADDKSKPQ